MINRTGRWAGLLLLLAGGWGAPPAAAQVRAPRIEFDRESLDLGTVSDETPIRATFVMRNAGRAPLRITDLETSCGCTAALLSAAELAPGARGDIAVTLDPRRVQDRATKTITVYSNDPLRPVIFLKLRAEVHRAVELGARVVNFGKVGLGETREFPLAIFHDVATPVAITRISASSRLLSFTHTHEMDGERPAYVITVRLAAGASPGPFADTIRVELDHPRYDRFDIPVRAHILGPVITTPEVLGLGIVRRNARPKREVTVTAPSLPGFRVERVESTSAHLIPEIRRVEPGHYRIAVHVGPEAPKGPLQATLRVYTNARAMPLVEAPVSAIVR